MNRNLYNVKNKAELSEDLHRETRPRTVCSFYRYVRLENPEEWRHRFFRALAPLGVRGRIYLAEEGINGQVSYPSWQEENLRTFLNLRKEFSNLRLNIAIEQNHEAFLKLTVKVRKRVVADGLEPGEYDLDRRCPHVDARTFNELAAREDSVIFDMRNNYECEVGHFKDAVLPDTATFRETLDESLKLLKGKEDRPILIYCTGGIRCEKAGSFLKKKGFKKVHQLEGGIIHYTREAKAHNLENWFLGKNFVFDERLGERISEDVLSSCHQCGETSDRHVNCRNEACRLLFIQCDSCAEKYEGCCSERCRDFKNLPAEEQRIKRKTRRFTNTRHFCAFGGRKLEETRVD